MAQNSVRLNVVLYQPQIPQNTGNVGRTCVALGAKLWLVQPLGFRMDDRYLRRAGLDYWRHLDYELVDRWECIRQRCPDGQWWLFTKSAARLYTEASYRPGDFLVFGSETTGLPVRLRDEMPDSQLRIPTTAQVRSLNLATAVGVAVYEARRQLHLAGVM